MDADELLRDVVYLRLEYSRLVADRRKLVAERRKIAAEGTTWARYGCNLGPVYGPELAAVPGGRGPSVPELP